MGKWVKNADIVDRIFAGQLVEVGEYYQMQAVEDAQFSSNSQLLSYITSGIAVMAYDNTGSKDITNINQAIDFLKGTISPEFDAEGYPLQRVVIREEIVKTEGDVVQIKGKSFAVPASIGWHTFDFSYPYPISIYDASFKDKVERAGDMCSLDISPDTTLGVLALASSISDTIFTVSQTVIDNMKRGRYVSIGGEDLGECVGIDTVNNTITVSTPATSAHSVNDLVKMTTRMVDNYYFDGVDVAIHFGEGMIGGSTLSGGTVLRFRYYNSVATAKTFTFALEVKY